MLAHVVAGARAILVSARTRPVRSCLAPESTGPLVGLAAGSWRLAIEVVNQSRRPDPESAGDSDRSHDLGHWLHVFRINHLQVFQAESRLIGDERRSLCFDRIRIGDARRYLAIGFDQRSV